MAKPSSSANPCVVRRILAGALLWSGRMPAAPAGACRAGGCGGSCPGCGAGTRCWAWRTRCLMAGCRRSCSSCGTAPGCGGNGSRWGGRPAWLHAGAGYVRLLWVHHVLGYRLRFCPSAALAAALPVARVAAPQQAARHGRPGSRLPVTLPRGAFSVGQRRGQLHAPLHSGDAPGETRAGAGQRHAAPPDVSALHGTASSLLTACRARSMADVHSWEGMAQGVPASSATMHTEERLPLPRLCIRAGAWRTRSSSPCTSRPATSATSGCTCATASRSLGR